MRCLARHLDTQLGLVTSQPPLPHELPWPPFDLPAPMIYDDYYDYITMTMCLCMCLCVWWILVRHAPCPLCVCPQQERSSFSPSASPQPNSTSSPVHAPAARPTGRMEEDPTRLPTHLRESSAPAPQTQTDRQTDRSQTGFLALYFYLTCEDPRAFLRDAFRE